jgi:hypothetical protein
LVLCLDVAQHDACAGSTLNHTACSWIVMHTSIHDPLQLLNIVRPNATPFRKLFTKSRHFV